jgi:hypothetical protein
MLQQVDADGHPWHAASSEDRSSILLIQARNRISLAPLINEALGSTDASGGGAWERWLSRAASPVTALMPNIPMAPADVRRVALKGVLCSVICRRGTGEFVLRFDPAQEEVLGSGPAEAHRRLAANYPAVVRIESLFAHRLLVERPRIEASLDECLVRPRGHESLDDSMGGLFDLQAIHEVRRQVELLGPYLQRLAPALRHSTATDALRTPPLPGVAGALTGLARVAGGNGRGDPSALESIAADSGSQER